MPTETTEAPVMEVTPVPVVPDPGTPEADAAFKAFEKGQNTKHEPAPKLEPKVEPKPAKVDDKSTTAEVKESEASEKDEETTADSDTAERGEDGKFKPKVQKRIQSLLKDRAEAETKAAEFEKRAQDAENRLAELKKTPSSDKPKAPRMAEFETIEAYETAQEKYIDDLTDWKAGDRERKQGAEQVKSLNEEAEKAAEAANEARREAFVERMKSSESLFEDFQQTITTTTSVMTPAMVEFFMESEHGPAVVYELAKGPEESRRIAALTPFQQLRELGKLEDSLTLKAAPETKTAPSKPPLPRPPTTLRGTAPAKTDPKEAAERGDFKAFEDRMNRKQYRH